MSRRYSCVPRSRPGRSRIVSMPAGTGRAGRTTSRCSSLHVLLEPVDLRRAARARGLREQHLRLERVDALLELLDHRVERVGQAVEDAVDEQSSSFGSAVSSSWWSSSSAGAGSAADGHDELAGDVDVHLDRLDRPVALVRPRRPCRRRAGRGRRRRRPSAAGRTRACPRARPGAGRAPRRPRSSSSSVGSARSIQKNSSRSRSSPIRSRSTVSRTSMAASLSTPGTVYGRDATRRRLQAGGDLPARLPAPRRPRRGGGAALGPVPRPGRAQAHRARLRARAAGRLARLLGAARPGAAAAHLGPAPPGLQRARPRRTSPTSTSRSIRSRTR